MKKTLLFFLLLFISTSSFPQFSITPVRQQTFPGDIRKFSYAGGKLFTVGYNIGVQSFFAKSTDEGATWNVFTQQPFTPKDNLKGISFADANTGWVAGDKGIIYKTTNGGSSWLSQTDTLVYKGALNDVYFFDASTGFACGSGDNDNSLIKTTNGGTKWSVVPLPVQAGSNVTLYEMYWDNPQKGIIIGSSGKYFLTTDGGNTWSANVVPSYKGALYGITKVDVNTYYIAGSQGQIYKSSDGGLTFSLLTSVSTSSMYGVEFTSSVEGYVFGSNGQIYKTTDAGMKWDVLYPFTSEVLRTSIKLNNKMLIGGYLSNIFVTADNGQTWKSMVNSGRDFYGVFAENDKNIIIAGGSASTNRSEINFTTDGGKYWSRPSLILSSVMYDAVKFGSNIYTCGQAGAYYISTDNGLSWQNASIPGSTAKNYKIAFTDADNGYMVTSDGKIMKTTNKGVNWSTSAQFSNVYLYDIKMLTPKRGFAVGSGERIYETYDGSSWLHGVLAQPVQQITGLYMLDDTRGFICGENGAVYKTDDGFRDITLLTDTTSLKGILIHDIFAFNDSVVWAVGQKGIILRSSSGNKMVAVDTVESGDDLTAISKINDSTLVVSGFNGSVFKIVDRSRKTVGVEHIAGNQMNYELQQNYPNPFNPNTKIAYTLPTQEKVELKIYDMLGKEIAVLVNTVQSKGRHTVDFNASDLSSGIYLYQLRAGSFKEIRKMALLK